jgi:hypothetical protein
VGKAEALDLRLGRDGGFGAAGLLVDFCLLRLAEVVGGKLMFSFPCDCARAALRAATALSMSI